LVGFIEFTEFIGFIGFIEFVGFIGFVEISLVRTLEVRA